MRAVGEDAAQAFLVAAIGRGCKPYNFCFWVVCADCVDHSLVGVGYRMVAFVDDHHVELGPFFEVVLARERLDHREDGVALPVLDCAVDDAGGDVGIDLEELGAVLIDEFIAVLEHEDALVLLVPFADEG